MAEGLLLITTVVLTASLVSVLFSRLGQLPMLGYVLTGVLLGPSFFGVFHSEKEIAFLAELGVILLLFLLGMHLPLDSFRKSYKSALAITFFLVAGSLFLTFGVGELLNWSTGERVVYGFVIALSSTAVGVKLIEQLKVSDRPSGQIALSVLIAQDIIFIPMVIITNALGGEGGIDVSFLPRLALAIGVLIAVIWFLSVKGRVHLLFAEWVEKHEDLIPIAALAWCFVGAYGSELLHLSPAFGSFLAGLIIGNSHSEERVYAKVEPMQSVLLMVFFVSVGLLIDLEVLINSWGTILFLLLSTMILKSALCAGLMRLMLPEHPPRCSFLTALTISQVGEFSFVITTTAVGAAVISEEGSKILYSVIALSLVFSPIWLSLLRRVPEWKNLRAKIQPRPIAESTS